MHFVVLLAFVLSMFGRGFLGTRLPWRHVRMRYLSTLSSMLRYFGVPHRLNFTAVKAQKKKLEDVGTKVSDNESLQSSRADWTTVGDKFTGKKQKDLLTL